MGHATPANQRRSRIRRRPCDLGCFRRGAGRPPGGLIRWRWFRARARRGRRGDLRRPGPGRLPRPRHWRGRAVGGVPPADAPELCGSLSVGDRCQGDRRRLTTGPRPEGERSFRNRSICRPPLLHPDETPPPRCSGGDRRAHQRARPAVRTGVWRGDPGGARDPEAKPLGVLSVRPRGFTWFESDPGHRLLGLAVRRNGLARGPRRRCHAQGVG
jgi:hypothetical protein